MVNFRSIEIDERKYLYLESENSIEIFELMQKNKIPSALDVDGVLLKRGGLSKKRLIENIFINEGIDYKPL